MELVEKENVTTDKTYIHRDISWLSFNYRVLQEAKDPRVPLYEKMKFLAIYSSNLGEFFRVRIASHKNVLKAGKKARKSLEYDPEKIIQKCLENWLPALMCAYWLPICDFQYQIFVSLGLLH